MAKGGSRSEAQVILGINNPAVGSKGLKSDAKFHDRAALRSPSFLQVPWRDSLEGTMAFKLVS